MTTWQLRRGAERFSTRTEGIRSWHSFSFGSHYDPDNVSFGALLAHNEELLEIGAGYPPHQHTDTEILTWVLSGTLVHEDSDGHVAEVPRGTAAAMSAGSGIWHSERNVGSAVAPVHFVQLWVRPDRLGRPPDYAVGSFALTDLAAGWLPVASGRQPDALLGLDAAGSTLWATTMAAGERRRLPESASGHLYVAAGAVEIDDVGRLGTGDALRTTDPAALEVRGSGPAELLLWETGS